MVQCSWFPEEILSSRGGLRHPVERIGLVSYEMIKNGKEKNGILGSDCGLELAFTVIIPTFDVDFLAFDLFLAKE